jgi:hypothetical protein
VPRRVRAQVVHGHLPVPQRQDVVLHRVRRERRQLALLVRLYVLPRRARYLAGWGRRIRSSSMPSLETPLRAPVGHNGQTTMLGCLWGALVQAFTVDDVFQRKIK